MVAVIWTFCNILLNAKYVRWKIFDTVWVMFDIMYVLGNGIISLKALSESYSETNHDESAGHNDLFNVKSIRILQSFMSIIIFGKLIYFLQLID